VRVRKRKRHPRCICDSPLEAEMGKQMGREMEVQGLRCQRVTKAGEEMEVERGQVAEDMGGRLWCGGDILLKDAGGGGNGGWGQEVQRAAICALRQLRGVAVG
jgi:hypothetical protein